MTGKKTVSHDKHLFGVLFEILLKKPLERLSRVHKHLSVRIKNGQEAGQCGNCLDPKGTETKCSFCDASLHSKCIEKSSCSKGCKGVDIEVTKIKHNDLCVVNGRSIFYDDLSHCMSSNQRFVSYQTISERALRDLEKIIKKNPKKNQNKVKMVMKNEVKSLYEIAEDRCVSLGVEYRMFKDERLREFARIRPARRNKEPEPAPETRPGLKDIIEQDAEDMDVDVDPGWKISEMVRDNGLSFLNQEEKAGDSWFASIISISNFYGDLEIPSDLVQLRRWIMRRILKLPIIPEWVDKYFGGSRAAFNKHIVSNFNPQTATDNNGLVCLGTAMVLKRRIRIIGEENARGGFKELYSNEETSRYPIYWIGHQSDRFRALVKPAMKDSEEIKRQRSKKKLTNAEKDEQRRREEKKKSIEKTDVEAMEKTIEALERKCLIVENELELAKRRDKVQGAFILSLERRIANACDSCREKDPELTIASRENYSLLEIKEMLLQQSEQLKSLMEGRVPVPENTGPAPERGENTTEL